MRFDGSSKKSSCHKSTSDSELERILNYPRKYDEDLNIAYAINKAYCDYLMQKLDKSINNLMQIQDRYAKVYQKPIGEDFYKSKYLACKYKRDWNETTKSWTPRKLNCGFVEPKSRKQ